MAPLGGRWLRGAAAGLGAARRLLLLPPPLPPFGAARGCQGSAAPRAAAAKKRGYDITRNPHLNKLGVLLTCLSTGIAALNPFLCRANNRELLARRREAARTALCEEEEISVWKM